MAARGRRGHRDRLRRPRADHARRAGAAEHRHAAEPLARRRGAARGAVGAERARHPRGRLRARPRTRLRDAGRARAATRTGSPSGLADGEIATVWLNYADPVRFHPDRALWERGLSTAQTVIAVDTVLSESARRVRRRRVPGRGVSREGGHGHQPRRPRAAAAPGDRPRQGPLGHARLGRARRLAGPRRHRRRLRARPRRADRGDGFAAAVRRGAVLRRADARRDRRPRRPLAGAQPGLGRRLGARPARRVADLPGRRHRQAAPRHVPQPVGRQDRRRLAAAALPAREADRRAVARGRGRRSASARAIASKSATTARG